MFGPSEQLRQQDDARLFFSWTALSEDGDATNTRKELENILDRLQPLFVVVDEPGDTRRFDDALVARGIDWLQFDGKRQGGVRARWIVNQLPDADASMYGAGEEIHSGRMLLLGPDYAPVRPGFIMRPADNHRLRHCVAVFGGGDDRGMLRKTIDAFSPLADSCSLTLISGESNPNWKDVEAVVAGVESAALVVQPKDISRVFADADLVITAGGTTVYELAAAGRPMLVVAVVDNQVEQSRAWAKRGACCFIDDGLLPSADSLRTNLLHLNDHPAKRLELGRRANALCDGRGAQRLAHLLATNVYQRLK